VPLAFGAQPLCLIELYGEAEPRLPSGGKAAMIDLTQAQPPSMQHDTKAAATGSLTFT